MRIDRSQEDKFAALFKAGKPKPKTARRTEQAGVDDESVPYVRPWKTQRERQIEAIDYEDRRAKKARELQQRRRARIASEFPSARRWQKTLDKIAPTIEVTGYLDCDVDLAGLAHSLSLAEIPDDYDRFTAVYETAVELVRKLSKGTKYASPDPATYFQSGCVTALDELKIELRIT